MDPDSVRPKMDKALEWLGEELGSLRAGRATPALVENIKVEAYETKMPLVELATISTPEPNQIIITPFDQTILRNIEQAISSHKEAQLSPVVDGSIIRVKIPPLTAERRKEFLRILSQKLEAARIMVRQVRQEERSQIKTAFENDELSEDAKYRGEENLQKVTDEYMDRIEQMGKKKEEELSEL